MHEHEKFDGCPQIKIKSQSSVPLPSQEENKQKLARSAVPARQNAASQNGRTTATGIRKCQILR